MALPSADAQSKTTNKENHLKNCTFAHSVRPFHCFSRLFGLMPFSIIHDPNGQAYASAVSILDGLWFTISIILYSLINFLVFQNTTLQLEPNTASYILILGDDLLLLANLFFGLLFLGIDMINRFKIAHILQEFNMFDLEVGSYNLDYCSIFIDCFHFVGFYRIRW